MKTKKKLLVPIAMLVLAVMAITSTTFAWFTTNSTVDATITNAKVSEDGTLLFVVDQKMYSDAIDAEWTRVYDETYTAQGFNAQTVYDDAVDEYIAAHPEAQADDPATVAYANAAVATARAAAEKAATDAADAVVGNKTFTDGVLANNENWAFETSVDYATSDLSMIDLTYTRDLDKKRGEIAKRAATATGDNGGLAFVVSPYAQAVYEMIKGDTTSKTAWETAWNGIWQDTYDATYYSLYSEYYADLYKDAYEALPDGSEESARIAAGRTAVETEYLDRNTTAVAGSAVVNNILSLAQTYYGRTTDIAKYESDAIAAATTDANTAASADAIAAIQLTTTANDTTYRTEYNKAYDASLAAAGVTSSTASDAQLAAADAAGIIAGNEAVKNLATTDKLREANYSHYNIDGANFTVEDGLYKKGVYSLDVDKGTGTAAEKVEKVVAKAEKDYIDLTYTFWCLEGSTNKLSLVLDESSIKNLVPTLSFEFTNSEKNYFLTQGPKDERVAKFYGTEIDALSIPAKDDEITSNGNFYKFNAAGKYTGSAADAARVMFTEISQTGGADEIVGIWEPNPNTGYDALNADGTRKYELDIQDMFNKAQTPTLFDDLAPIEYINRYDSTTDPELLSANSVNEIDLLTFDDNGVKTNGYVRAQLNVKIWLEGFDSDCFNVILGDALDIALQFKATTIA